MHDERSPYERLGGEGAVRELVDRFYDAMDTLPEAAAVRLLHPEDLTSSRDKLFLFLSGWLGGPPLYVQQHGHPRLRMRHLPFPIDRSARDAWLLCLDHALAPVGDRALADVLRGSLARVADHMRNQQESP